jgi:hypothetical protein
MLFLSKSIIFGCKLSVVIVYFQQKGVCAIDILSLLKLYSKEDDSAKAIL